MISAHVPIRDWLFFDDMGAGVANFATYTVDLDFSNIIGPGELQDPCHRFYLRHLGVARRQSTAGGSVWKTTITVQSMFLGQTVLSDRDSLPPIDFLVPLPVLWNGTMRLEMLNNSSATVGAQTNIIIRRLWVPADRELRKLKGPRNARRI